MGPEYSEDICTLFYMTLQERDGGEMAGWHHRLNGHEFEQTQGDKRRTGKPGVLQSMESQRAGHD